MTAIPGKTRRFFRWLIIFARRVLNRLRFFPFTLALVLLNAAQNLLQLWRGVVVVHTGDAAGNAQHMPRNTMLWVDRCASERRIQPCDACILLSRDSAREDLHDVFSAMVAFPRFRSLGLYWDAAALEDDLPLWGKRTSVLSAAGASFDALVRLPGALLDRFFQGDHAEIALPVAVTREAQNFLKRQVGAAQVVVLNLSAELAALADDVASTHPDVHFFDLASPSGSGAAHANCWRLFGHGLTLHERMALVQAADAYIGRFDEMGCAAIITARAALLLGSGDGGELDEIVRAKNVIWLPAPLVPTLALRESLQFVFSCVEAQRNRRA